MKKIIAVFLPFLLISCLKEGNFKLPYQGYSPQSLSDGWEVSSPFAENMDTALLNVAYQLIYREDRFPMARALLVFRHGKLVAEAYPNDLEDINRLHNIQSCTKSVTSLLVGIAKQNAIVDSLEEPLYQVFPEDFDEEISKRSIRLLDALEMRTGLEFDNGTHTLSLYQTEGASAAYVLSQEQIYPSGVVMNYNDGAPHLVSKYLEKKTGRNLALYAESNLFNPLAIDDYLWEKAKDGTTYGAFSLYLKARDFGKIGQLLLNQGIWEQNQLIDSNYLAAATTTQVAANFNSEPYGYYFWILPAYNGYAALGHGGQFLLVVPDKELLVVYLAWPYTSGAFFDQRNELMNLIVESCL